MELTKAQKQIYRDLVTTMYVLDGNGNPRRFDYFKPLLEQRVKEFRDQKKAK